MAKVLESVPGVELTHDCTNTGTKQGHYFVGGVERRVQPDIHGTYYGRPFIIDTKLKENSYVDRRDVDKLYRDGAVLGAKPVMVHSGGLISEVRECVVLHHYTHTMVTRMKDNVRNLSFIRVTMVHRPS